MKQVHGEIHTAIYEHTEDIVNYDSWYSYKNEGLEDEYWTAHEIERDIECKMKDGIGDVFMGEFERKYNIIGEN